MAADAEDSIERRFALAELAGRGASSDVYRGTDRETGQPVAVKRLRPNLTDTRAVHRLAREARLLTRIHSPHVVRHIAYGADDAGRACLVLEWLDGEDLARRQASASLEIPQAVDVARQAALGLAALHAVGIVHRDVKPANFFLVPDAAGGVTVKLLDLGISRAVDEVILTQHGLRVGTPAYMSPEQARGDDNVTSRADLFALGVVLYELVSGKRAYAGRDAFAVLARILLENPPRLRDAAPGIAPELDALCARAMARAPEARFESAQAMAEALARVPFVGQGTRRLSVHPEPNETQTELPRLGALATLEQRVVTAVFAAFADRPDVNYAMEVFDDIVAEHGGTTERTLGRRMIGVFGGQHSRGDEVVRAGRAALSAAALIRRVGLAVSTGRALAGGAEIAGEALDRGAAAVERSRGEVRVDAVTARLLGGYFVIEGAEGDQVLRGEHPPETGVTPVLLGHATPTVGRDGELAVAHQFFARCCEESAAGAVLITGPMGAGKTRVRHEFLRQLGQRGAVFELLLGRDESLGEGSAFGALATAVRRAAGIFAGEPTAMQREKLRARVARHVPAGDVTRVAAFLGELASVRFTDDECPALRAARADAIQMGDAMREAWLEWLAHECGAAPVVLVLEDLHWADLPSVRFVDAALRTLVDQPLFVLALARPEVHARFPALWLDHHVHEVRLGPLPRRACERLVREVLGELVADDIVARMVERAEGNPFYLEELVRAVDGANPRALPDTVVGVVQARLDALGADAKRVLRTASLFGRRFWRGGVCALLGDVPVAALLEELVEREVLVRRSTAALPGEREYYFPHALLREVAYATLTDDDRAAGHRAAGAWLEGAGATDAAVLAAHFDRGRAPARAATWYRRAAEQALEGNDFAGAIARAERGHLCADDPYARGAFRLIQADAHAWHGALGAATARGLEAAQTLEPGTSLWFRAVGRVLASHGLQGQFDGVEAWAGRALSTPAQADALGAKVVCLCRAVEQLLGAGRVRGVEVLMERTESIAVNLGDGDAAAASRLQLTRALRLLDHGRLEDFVRETEAAAVAFERLGDVRNLARARSEIAFGYAELGELLAAEAVVRPALAFATRAGLQIVVAWTQHNLGGALQRQGRFDEAREAEQAAAAIARAQGVARLEAAARGRLADIECATGGAAAALREARAALEAAGAVPAFRVGPLAALSRALLAMGTVAGALEAAEQAVGLLRDEPRVVEGEARARVAHVEALTAAGELAAAVAAITHAHARLLARADAVRAPGRREKYLGELPEHRRTLELYATLAGE